ncbi:MAG: cupin domain-containing protein [Actinomycetia bacterium]|nr:cupin domain-containing protein [Actinomycetes bacterium]
MTSSTPASEQPHPTGAAALSRLLGATSVADFAAAYWGRKPHRSAIGEVADLLSSDAVDELISVRGLRAPFLRVAKDGKTFADREFTSGGGVGAAVGDQLNDDLIWRHFESGATLVLQGLHRTHEPILRFTQDLAGDLGHPCQVNAYITPPQSTGFSDHYDIHDVFVIQIEGEKRWRIREPVWPLPLRDQPWDQHAGAVAAAANEEPLEEFVMTPGDVLYLPRGYLHSATALGEVSIHLTIGVHQWTRQHVAEQLAAAALSRLADDESARGSLALGVDVGDTSTLGDDITAARDALTAALADLPDAAVAAALAGRARAAQRSGPLAPLAQLRAARQGSDRVELRAHLFPRLERDPLRLITRLGTVPLQPADEDEVAKLLEPGGPVTVSSDLAERLLRAGICIPSTV